MMNLLTYAGCIHRFEINHNGYLQIDIFGYDHNTEKFVNIIDKPLIPSITIQSNQCVILGSSLIDQGLGVLLHLITSNSSILMFLQIQSRPWLCQIIYTLTFPLLTYGTMKFLAINSLISIFINEDKYLNGFYIIDNKKINQEKSLKNIQFIQCSLLTYIYCYLKDNYYWLIGTDIDLNTERKLIQVYYGCSTSLSIPLVSFNTNKFIPLSLIDNIQIIHVINHKFQLKSRLIVGDVIISSHDYRILTCHHGRIIHELSMNHLIISIQLYHTIENEDIYLFKKQNNQIIDIYQYDNQQTLIPFINTNEIADLIFIDDFIQIGWKQILFLKNNFDFNSFLLTDFSQIHHFNDQYHTEEKCLMDDDTDIQPSLIFAHEILRKKIINADFLINEGYFQCKQIENDIQKLTNKYHLLDLNIQLQSDNPIQLIDLNWFIYRTNLFLYVTIKNITNTTLSSIYLFGIDKQSNKMKIFNLKTTLPCCLTEQNILNIKPNSSLIFILTTLIELDKDFDLELYLLINDKNQLFYINSIHITIDDLFYLNNHRILNLNQLENDFISQQLMIYLNTLFSLSINIQTISKLNFIEHFQQLLLTIGFKSISNLKDFYLRINQGNIFEHILIHLIYQDDLIIHFYAKNSNEILMIIKYILSKVDYQSFSLINTKNNLSEEENNQILNRIQIELKSYIDILKTLPTIMRKITSTSKSESYRLLKYENYQTFQNESSLTDLLLASFIVD